jgi:hypothetical protein
MSSGMLGRSGGLYPPCRGMQHFLSRVQSASAHHGPLVPLTPGPAPPQTAAAPRSLPPPAAAVDAPSRAGSARRSCSSSNASSSSSAGCISPPGERAAGSSRQRKRSAEAVSSSRGSNSSRLQEQSATEEHVLRVIRTQGQHQQQHRGASNHMRLTAQLAVYTTGAGDTAVLCMMSNMEADTQHLASLQPLPYHSCTAPGVPDDTTKRYNEVIHPPPHPSSPLLPPAAAAAAPLLLPGPGPAPPAAPAAAPPVPRKAMRRWSSGSPSLSGSLAAPV